jgi:hypothetical protein
VTVAVCIAGATDRTVRSLVAAVSGAADHEARAHFAAWRRHAPALDESGELAALNSDRATD